CRLIFLNLWCKQRADLLHMMLADTVCGYSFIWYSILLPILLALRLAVGIEKIKQFCYNSRQFS
ncbi:hypothetical protein, partial [Eikenella corrodens]|uniref:hypothetical protein n=1 Tax=Eikenella corrodens TaxID=539 RepID=UPI0028E98332